MINITSYLEHKSKLSNPSPNRFIKDAKEFLMKYAATNSFNTTDLKIIFYMYVNNLNKIPKCEYKSCQKSARFITFFQGFSKGCCHIHAKKISNIELFGVETPFESKQIQDKVKETFLERYGNSNHLATDNFKETMIKLYGYEIAMKSPLIKSRLINNITNKFGGMGNASKEICAKTTKTNKSIFLKKLDSIDYPAIRLFSDNEYEGVKGWLKKYKWKCKKCTTIFTETITDGMVARCPKCFPKMTIGISQAETILYSRLNDLTIERSNKSILHGRELDMYSPHKKIAIEYNGLYWHSDYKVGNNYHLWKTEACLKYNIKLIHVFESDWHGKQEQILSLINCKLGNFKNYYSGNFNIQQIEQHQYVNFINDNSIFQPHEVDCIYGLFIDTDMVSILSIIHERNNVYVINDFVTLLNTDNDGYLSILLNHFISIHKPHTIKVQIDRRYFNGTSFINFGFQLIDTIPPKCWGFGNQTILEIPNDNHDSEHRIWDCGYYVFKWTR